MKDWWFLFSPDNMPLGVFLTETLEESRNLFCKLYRRSWDDMVKVGIYMEKEQDVPPAIWDEIYIKYQARKKKYTKPHPVLLKPKTIKEFFAESTNCSTQLETEKYLRR